MRDDFTLQTKELLAKRVGYRCSNPGCRQPTSGPRWDSEKSISVGFAAHVSAASPGGPRYDDTLTPAQRRHPDNGIWLCGNCAKLVDNDECEYTPNYLRQWKSQAEQQALKEIERPRESLEQGRSAESAVFARLEQQMPDLLAEMRNDLVQYPLSREFVLLKRSWTYWARGEELMYYFDDHPQLKNQVMILENCGLVTDVTRTSVDRYRMSEDFVECLSR